MKYLKQQIYMLFKALCSMLMSSRERDVLLNLNLSLSRYFLFLDLLLQKKNIYILAYFVRV